MGEFGSNNDDNERKEKTSERAREREGGGRERESARSRRGRERERKEKGKNSSSSREVFPPPSSLFSVSSFSSFRKKTREKYMQKTEREAFFESGARGRVDDEKAREREKDGRGRGLRSRFFRLAPSSPSPSLPTTQRRWLSHSSSLPFLPLKIPSTARETYHVSSTGLSKAID
jgi:hypothetical protein